MKFRFNNIIQIVAAICAFVSITYSDNEFAFFMYLIILILLLIRDDILDIVEYTDQRLDDRISALEKS